MLEHTDPATLVASGAIVVFLVQQAKRWVSSHFLPLLALSLGIVVQLVNDLALSSAQVTSATVWTSVLLGAGVGMAAAGAYDLSRSGTVSETRDPYADDPRA